MSSVKCLLTRTYVCWLAIVIFVVPLAVGCQHENGLKGGISQIVDGVLDIIDYF